MSPATRDSISPRPDFAALFPVRDCNCGREDCEICQGWQLTPRTADLLHTALEIMADQAFDDIEDGPDCLEEREDAGDEEHDVLPRHGDDYDWGMCSEVLFQDHDVLMLYDESFDGIEDPDGDANQYLRMGDLRPGTWFECFGNVEPRDARRGFRR